MPARRARCSDHGSRQDRVGEDCLEEINGIIEVPNTLTEDGDPVDVLVVTDAPPMSGVVIPCRPIGMLHMEDEAGSDARILAVPTTRLAPLYEEVRDCTDVARSLRDGNAHFFEQYKALEPGKWARVDHWSGADEAKAEIVACVERFKNRAA